MNRPQTLDASLADVSVGQRCTAHIGNIRCTRAAVFVGIQGCVHEHVRTIAHCPNAHRMVTAGLMRCTDCVEAGHDCYVRVVYQ